MDFWCLTDDELIERIESFDDAGDRGALDAALTELFRRLRDDSSEDRNTVERVIRRLESIYSSDDEDGPDSLGVREPRRPAPSAGNASCAIDAPDRGREVA